MFTGIVQAVGKIEAIVSKGSDSSLEIACGKLPLEEVRVGDSIAVSGVCLTAVALTRTGFAADVSRETLTRTTLGEARVGTLVNLELAMTPKTRLGGHLVLGHVDGIGSVTACWEDGRSVRLRIKAPAELARYIAAKGSICVEGVSLTVNRVEGAEFEVNLVPHTLAETTLGMITVGARVNLEVDLIARYLERLLLGEQAAEAGVSLELLKRYGWV